MKRALVALAVAACASASPGATTHVSDDASAPAPPAADAATPVADAAAPVDATEEVTQEASVPSGPPPSALPVTYTRPDVGTPLTQAELDAATDELVALLKGTRYFDVLDERIHGWPESAGGFSYGTWWSGVTVTKANGVVTYTHGADGADNNGLRTAQLLEGACYAHLEWGNALAARLVRRIARGYASWALAMKRDASDTGPALLARASYPASVTSHDGGRTIVIDYAADRPGNDGASSEYVHLPANPTFGDVWIKNKRSKDDMGHVYRSLVQALACAPRLDASAQADLAQAKSLYVAWALQVEADGWSIATLDKNAQTYVPPVSETLAHYTLAGNVECPGALMLRLFAHPDPGALDCGSGISALEQIAGGQISNSAKQILRTSHEAAVNAAFLAGQNGPGLALLQGLASRVETDLGLVNQPSPPSNVNPSDVAALLLHASNAGVPLTSAEVRWLHARLHAAHDSYLAAPPSTYDVFAAPDGTYPYEPSGDGLAFGDIGVFLGACAAPYRNPATRPLLDCARLRAAF
jgi:hypothetical protein